MNKIELIGTVGRVYLNKVGALTISHFSLLVEDPFTSIDNEVIVQTLWCNCTAYNVEVEKGQKVHIIGRVSARHYTSEDGSVHTSWEVVVKDIAVVK